MEPTRRRSQARSESKWATETAIPPPGKKVRKPGMPRVFTMLGARRGIGMGAIERALDTAIERTPLKSRRERQGLLPQP